MNTNVKVRGIAPGFLLLPAREYEWELDRKIEIRIPRTGSIRDLLSNNPLTEGVEFPGEEDGFSLYEDNLFTLWELVRVLFANAQYPALEDDQCLNVVALEVLVDEIVLYGEIIKQV